MVAEWLWLNWKQQFDNVFVSNIQNKPQNPFVNIKLSSAIVSCVEPDNDSREWKWKFILTQYLVSHIIPIKILESVRKYGKTSWSL